MYYLLAGWFLLNFFSAWFTELSYDEAYYWMYSRFPAWGYFDHPPLIAWIDGVGSFLLPEEAGVRLFIPILSCITLWLLHKMIHPAAFGTFALMVLSVFPFQMFGFMSVPDVPLLLFGALFFYSYQQFLKENTTTNTLMLAFSMVGLMYSKYHGIIFMAATFASNPGLIKNRKALFAVVLSLLLYIPHLWWQYQHDFITFWFHLSGRSASAYQFSFTAEYLLVQILFYGPATGILLFYTAWRYRAVNLFERALTYTFFGTFVFFLLSTFKGRVEANWTIPALIPMTYLSIRYLEEKAFLLKWLKISALLSIPVFLIVRLVLAFPGEVYFHRMGEIVGWKIYTREVMQKAGNLPLMANTYQEASKLSFYSGRLIPSLNLNGRRNQYDLWNLAVDYEGKKVILLNNYQKQGIVLTNPKKDTSYLTPLTRLPLYQGLRIQAEDHSLKKNTTAAITLKIVPLSEKVPASLDSPTAVRYSFYDKKTNRTIKQDETWILPIKDKKGNWNAIATITTPEKSGTYKVTFSFLSTDLGDWGTWKSSTFKVD